MPERRTVRPSLTTLAVVRRWGGGSDGTADSARAMSAVAKTHTAAETAHTHGRTAPPYGGRRTAQRRCYAHASHGRTRSVSQDPSGRVRQARPGRARAR